MKTETKKGPLEIIFRVRIPGFPGTRALGPETHFFNLILASPRVERKIMDIYFFTHTLPECLKKSLFFKS